jgi:4-hydroxy-2-oxoheptanedioate aldolase
MKSWLFLLCLGASAFGQTPPARLNRAIELFEKGVPPLGIFASNLSVRSAAALASSSLDFVIIDLEHSPADLSRLETYLLGMIDKQRVASEGLRMNVVPIVRLPANAREHVEFLFKQVLDLGAFGILVPHVNNAQDAMAAVVATRFPQLKGAPDFLPAGHRGVGYGWAARYWGLPGPQYSARADVWPLDSSGEILLWLMIESVEGVGNIRDILKTPGVSGVFVGPSDLAFSMGVPLDDSSVEAEIAKVLAACKETGVPCGTLTSPGEVPARLRQGFRFLAVGGDAGISGGVERALEAGRKR